MNDLPPEDMMKFTINGVTVVVMAGADHVMGKREEGDQKSFGIQVEWVVETNTRMYVEADWTKDLYGRKDATGVYDAGRAIVYTHTRHEGAKTGQGILQAIAGLPKTHQQALEKLQDTLENKQADLKEIEEILAESFTKGQEIEAMTERIQQIEEELTGEGKDTGDDPVSDYIANNFNISKPKPKTSPKGKKEDDSGLDPKTVEIGLSLVKYTPYTLLDDMLKSASPAHRSDLSRYGARVIRKNLAALRQKTVEINTRLEKLRNGKQRNSAKQEAAKSGRHAA